MLVTTSIKDDSLRIRFVSGATFSLTRSEKLILLSSLQWAMSLYGHSLPNGVSESGVVRFWLDCQNTESEERLYRLIILLRSYGNGPFEAPRSTILDELVKNLPSDALSSAQKRTL